MPPSRPSRHTADTDLTQVTWVVADRTYSREFDIANTESVRAHRLGLYGVGARNVSTTKIPAGTTYTAYGER